uniref:Tubulin-specific chaperone E n=1 Tax=Electrophorus electricus TaxID=8005 RepID=A0A4W4DT25_ELEEL
MKIREEEQSGVASEVPEDATGRRLTCEGERATVRYVGPVPPTTGSWLGVEWDNPERGKHDGSHEGVRYFTCRHPSGGSFVRAKKTSFGVDYLTAVKQHYEAGLDEATGNEVTIATKTVKMVGFESIWDVINELDKLQALVQLSCKNNPLMELEDHETTRQLLIARISQLEKLDKSQVLQQERRGAELDYCKKFGRQWLHAGGHKDPDRNKPSAEFTAQHPRYLALIQKYGAPEEDELKEQKPFALKNQLLTVTFECPEDADRKPIQKKLPGSMIVQKVKGLLYRLLKLPGAEIHLTYTSSKMEGREIEINNDLKPLQFYSIEDGDRILVRWS